jgi:predicted enzyme related to lactoylglutathione lyase
MAGRLVHFEIPAQDDERATQFYGSLFGWQWNTAEMGPGFNYHMVQFDEQTGGAVYRSPDGLKGPIVYFDTDDIDGDVARVRELGGDSEEKQPIPGIGWFARCTDTEGNPFSLFQGDGSVPHDGS